MAGEVTPERLAEIERYRTDRRMEYVSEGAYFVHHPTREQLGAHQIELAAALRQAWAERDALFRRAEAAETALRSVERIIAPKFARVGADPSDTACVLAARLWPRVQEPLKALAALEKGGGA